MSDDHLHLMPLVERLLAAGNSIKPHPATTEPFRPSQGEYHCPLTKPIDFSVLRDIPRDQKLHFVEDEDYIFCEHCWTVILGGNYQPRSIDRPSRDPARTARRTSS